MKVHQLVHTLSYGDAISSEAITIKRLLGGNGGEIFSLHAHELVRSERRDLSDLEGVLDREPGALLLHFSIASPLNQLFVEREDLPRAMIYHNVTPAHWFRSYNPRVCGDLEAARRDLARTISSADILLGDSTYNCQELFDIAGRRAEVLPLVFDQKKWSVEANPGIAELLRSHGGKNLLFVGRIAPNKCIEDVIKLFYFYHHKIDQRSKLWIVGSDIDCEIYAFELRELVRNLRLKDAVTFTGPVADSELKAFYQGSDCYISLSEHEGFCVPVMEAMWFGVPVVTYDAGAVSETVGEGAALVTKKLYPEMAELVNILCQPGELRSQLIENGRQRVSAFSESAIAAALPELVVKPLMSVNKSSKVVGGNS